MRKKVGWQRAAAGKPEAKSRYSFFVRALLKKGIARHCGLSRLMRLSAFSPYAMAISA